MDITPITFKEFTPTRHTKEKNLLAIVIFLIGLFAGSLFVDIGQLLVGAGFSRSAVDQETVLETAGKTWVAYTDPAIDVRVVSDDTCDLCSPDEALLWLRRIIPTLRAHRVAADSFAGQELIMKHGLTSLPAFVFEQGVEQTNLFAEAAPLFRAQGTQYFFDMNKIGLPVGKYLAPPEYAAGDIRLGNPDAKVTVTLFSDFACEYCQQFHATYTALLEKYHDRVAFVFKHFPLPNHPAAPSAALAASCADAQGQFRAYADLLFAKQADWTTSRNLTLTLKNYAWRIKGLKGQEFGKCVDEKRFNTALEADSQLATKLSLQAAPTLFVGSDFLSGAAPQETVEKLIDSALEKAN